MQGSRRQVGARNRRFSRACLKRPASALLAATLASAFGTGNSARVTLPDKAPWDIMQPKLVWTQHSIHQTVAGFLPAPLLQGFVFPCIEDLLNKAPMDLYSRWTAGQGTDLFSM